jgi:hypothetical protein
MIRPKEVPDVVGKIKEGGFSGILPPALLYSLNDAKLGWCQQAFY